jgi:hypothetical protein
LIFNDSFGNLFESPNSNAVDIQVTDVVALVPLDYDPTTLLDAGIHVHLLPLAGPVPTHSTAATFRRIAAAARGAVAVHCAADSC